MMKQKKTPEVFIFGGLLNFWVGFLNLHSHTLDANIDLFENFIENFIEIEVKLKRTSKDDFIELH